MTKTYHFMAGLPRSGSTLLSALLNQHPEIYASPTTDLLTALYQVESIIFNTESYKAGLHKANIQSVLSNIADNYYAGYSKKVIIDKNRVWGTPYNITNVAPYVNPNGKVILTMRPILEVLASFIKITEASERITKQPAYLNRELWVSSYRTKREAQVDNLMRPNGEIDQAIFSIANLLKNHKDKVHVIWFDDLLNKPQESLNAVYRFLGVKEQPNNFQNIKAVDKHDDLSGYGIAGLHDVGKKLIHTMTKPEDYLPQYSIDKYRNALDFLEL